MDQNLRNWMLTGIIFLAHAAMFLVALLILQQRATAGGVLPFALTTVTVTSALTGTAILMGVAAIHETRLRAAAGTPATQDHEEPSPQTPEVS